jgi:hypothetical protein
MIPSGSRTALSTPLEIVSNPYVRPWTLGRGGLESLHAEEPRMARVVAICAKQPLLVIPEQRYHTPRHGLSKVNYPLNATLRIGSAIDVVPKKDDGVVFGNLSRNPIEKIIQSR